MVSINTTKFRLKFFLGNHAFILLEKWSSVFCRRRRLEILFGRKDEWEASIRKGFRGLRHNITFASLGSTPIKNYDLVVGLTYEEILLLSQNDHQQWLPVPRTDCIKLCHDKYRFAMHMVEMGFRENIPLVDDDLGFPFILKKKLDSWGQNTHVVKNKVQLQALLKLIQRDEYFCQACVPGRFEYASHLLVVGGKIVHSLTIQHLFESETAVNGKEDRISRIAKCEYLELFTRILNSVGFEGLCCIDYKIWNGKPMIFEINPRFGGSLQHYFFAFIRHLDFPDRATGTPDSKFRSQVRG